MDYIHIRHPQMEDKEIFIEAMKASKILHYPWVEAPYSEKDFLDYYEKYQLDNNKSYIVFLKDKIVGIINLNEIVRGCFQSAYLGFYATINLVEQGYMSVGLKLTMADVFEKLDLHRLEANIQSQNHKSISFIKKHGFKKEGFSPRYLKIQGEWCDHERWAITIEDWLTFRKIK